VDLDAPLTQVMPDKFSSPTVVTMKSTDKAIHGFHMLRKGCLAAIPVVDTNNNLVATLSASDLRGLESDHMDVLSLPVLDYLKATSAIKLNQVTVTPEDSLRHVLRLAVSHKVHRVWVVKSGAAKNQLPLTVVSFSDILRVFQ
jgi:CBS domain-containing protein